MASVGHGSNFHLRSFWSLTFREFMENLGFTGCIVNKHYFGLLLLLFFKPILQIRIIEKKIKQQRKNMGG